ncbi:MAG: hypothetical protein A2015_02660 [Spirochaetes bacterium GWF1_31_7]|nr:MAG: hypothetical protein A2Y30_10170 [Spirochaetes bacterium GWE1_32_154]OHD44638.1 MAG: hypothetical protein A2Y29_05870 [Spirochaetes bacterium GWE2_31_10]OHD53166.1 MAG: hypothetical protein A2015_02660 [Spirochaetes bacterium GWF1_31_7]OHD73224.1 MAG: hypothetical protein A2355_14155 [Spirochaetes bacterium RIFOXYB1_FULL_32_8]HBD94223.1 hypothetical protein [Spirochaetia bacterium]
MNKLLCVLLFVVLTTFTIHPKSKYYISLLEGLRLRNSPAIKSKIIRKLDQGEVVQFITFGKTEVLDNITGNWIKVRTTSKETGWVFGGYLNRFLSIESPSGYCVSYPEKWTLREETNNQVVYLQVASYTGNDEIAPGEEVSADQVKIEAFIFDNIDKNAIDWARSLEYIYDIKENPNAESGCVIGVSKHKYKTVEHTIFVKNRKGVVINYYPPDSIYKKAAENIINSFTLAD